MISNIGKLNTHTSRSSNIAYTQPRAAAAASADSLAAVSRPKSPTHAHPCVTPRARALPAAAATRVPGPVAAGLAPVVTKVEGLVDFADWSTPGLTAIALPSDEAKPFQWVIAPSQSDTLVDTESLLYVVEGEALLECEGSAPVRLKANDMDVTQASASVPKKSQPLVVTNSSKTTPLRLARFDLLRDEMAPVSETIVCERLNLEGAPAKGWLPPTNGSLIQFGPDSVAGKGGLVISKFPANSISNPCSHLEIKDYYYMTQGSATVRIQEPGKAIVEAPVSAGSWIKLAPRAYWQLITKDEGYTVICVVAPQYRHAEFTSKSYIDGFEKAELGAMAALEKQLNQAEWPPRRLSTVADVEFFEMD